MNIRVWSFKSIAGIGSLNFNLSAKIDETK